MKLDVEISGIGDLERMFSRLPSSTQRRAIQPSMRQAMNIVKELAVANVKLYAVDRVSGTLSRSLQVAMLPKYQGQQRMAVRVRPGAVNKTRLINGEPVRVGLYAAVLQYGKEGQPPRPWMTNAIAKGRTPASEKFRREMAKRMPLAVEEARRK